VSAEPAPFEILEHTADVGVLARGRTLAEAFAHAAEGMFSIMVDLEGVREVEQRSIAVAGHDWPGLLVAWLSELLYYSDVDGLLFKRFEVEDMRPYTLRAVARRADRPPAPRAGRGREGDHPPHARGRGRARGLSRAGAAGYLSRT
jgi:SHS2 domain-containing protein